MTTLLVRTHWHHPEWVALAVAGAGWSVLLVVTAEGSAARLAPAMAAAMMAPLVLDQVRQAAQSSLWRRRYRAVVGFLVGYLAVWTAAGAVTAIAAAALVTQVGASSAASAAFVVAAVAPLAPARRRRVRGCAATVPLAVHGWAADRDCLRWGVATGSRCVATCWALMAAVMVQHLVAVMVAATALSVLERRRPDLDPRVVALAVAVLGCVSVALGSVEVGGFLLPAVGHPGH